MARSTIPIHELPNDATSSIRVDHILKVKSEVQNEVHRHAFHELFFLGQGSGTHMIDLDQFKIDPPCLHVVGPGQVHRLSRSPSTSGSVVMFTQEVELGLGSEARRQLYSPGSPTTCALSKEQLRTAFQIILQLEQELKDANNESAAGFLAVLLLKCSQWISGGNNDGHRPAGLNKVEQFKVDLENRFTEDRKVSNYADRLNITPGHLNELCKAAVGQSASEVIQQRTLLEAKRLLLHSDLSIKEVAYALSMDDPAYFTRMFRRLSGSTPHVFREHIREKYQ